ncbi:signal peptidase I [Candidatus Aquicultor secundus]|nr:signal peptidase I [Candidatus Aquicultor secundus]NCO65577.1 signal peptidase I [Solirubrobacter sp.]
MSDSEKAGADSGIGLANSLANDSSESNEIKSEPRGKDSFVSFLKELPVLVITAVIIAFVIKWLVVQPFYIPSGSMEPTLVPGDRVLVSKFIYRFVQPKPGDIIVFIAPNGDGRDFIKRIVATGGDTVEVKEGRLYVNGKPSQGDYKTMPGDYSNFPAKKIPKGRVFVMGDNRPNSMDARVFGPLDENAILGRAFTVYWPLDHMTLLN